VVEARKNLDYGMDDQPLDEAARMPEDDYLSTDRAGAMDTTSGLGAPTVIDSSTDDGLVMDEDDLEETDAPSTFGAP
jgi:hypothetical protein